MSDPISRLVRAATIHAGKRVVWLCSIFAAWSVLGVAPISDLWLPLTWFGADVYVVGHVILAGLVLRAAGLRLWSVALCVVGLWIGERDVLFTAWAFTTWHFGGFV